MLSEENRRVVERVDPDAARDAGDTRLAMMLWERFDRICEAIRADERERIGTELARQDHD